MNKYDEQCCRFLLMVENLDEWETGFLIITRGNKFNSLGKNRFRLDAVNGFIFLVDSKDRVSAMVDITVVEGVSKVTSRGL